MPNATPQADARTLPEAAGGPTHDGDRVSDLEEPLRDAQVWASLLEKVVEDMERWPSFSKLELTIAIEQIEYIAAPLKSAVDRMDTIYHERTKEEART